MKTKFTELVVYAAAFAACANAEAQNNVAIYGIIDTGILYTTNVNANGDSLVKMPSLTGTFPSRLGFRGTEDLGGGNLAVFVLEEGFGPDTGATGQGGRLFGRQAYVGIKGRWGQLSVGRQYTMTYIATQKTDVLGPNILSMSSLDSYLPNARSDNTIAYWGAFDGINVGATYSLGRDVSNAGGPAATNCPGELSRDAKACRQVSFLLGYDSGGYGVNATYDRMRGGPGAAGGLGTSDATDRRLTANGYYMFGDVKFGLGIIDRRMDNGRSVQARSDLYYLGVSVPLTPALILDTQVSQLAVKASPNDARLTVARLTYLVSKRTALYASLGYISNAGQSAIAIDTGGTAGVGKNQVGLMTGIRHTF